MSPREVVEAYLNQAFTTESLEEKPLLLRYTAGPLRAAIAGVQDETFTEAYVAKRYTLYTYSFVRERSLTPREHEITFRLRYKEENQPAEVDNENTVTLIRDEGRWYITGVVGGSTAFNFLSGG